MGDETCTYTYDGLDGENDKWIRECTDVIFQCKGTPQDSGFYKCLNCRRTIITTGYPPVDNK